MVTEQKTRNESQRPREKWGAYRSGDEVVGTPTKSLLAFSDLLAGKKNFLFEFSMYLSVTTCILSAKRFFSRFRATSQEQENKLAMHSGIAAYKKKNSSFTYCRRFPFSDLT